ncbi:hypothetical protein TWF718_002178 [Orbilia javanica]|uniref:Nephrocystin 3-like N-terminal domain-containing protein n=1 Tax=Orbilia javanica TaxID=47235 RepID=A0AAN8MHC3_9PEZI
MALELAAAVAGLASIADLIVNRGYKYYSGVKEAKKEIQGLLDETALLHGALNSLRFAILRFGEYAIGKQLGVDAAPGSEASAILKDIFMTSECMVGCQKVLSRLRDELPEVDDHQDSSRFARIGSRLTWPFKKDETKQITESIQRHKSNIMIAVHTNTISALVSALKGLDEVKDIAEEVRIGQIDIIARLERIELDNEKKRVLDWASNMNPRASYQTNLNFRHTGTAKWFADRDEYQEWKSTLGSRLWLFGSPGAGKSVMVSSIIESLILEMEDGDAIAFHYCDYKSKDPPTLDEILCSLVRQASAQRTSAFKTLKGAYDEHNSNGFTHSNLRDSGTDLPKLLSQVSKAYENLIIVVDGLDEYINREELAKQLMRLPEIGSNRIKVLVASRPETDLENILYACDKIEIAASKSDVQLYVASVVEERIRSRRLKLRGSDLKGLIQDGLVEGCKGMFQWVVCQIDYLCQLNNDKERRNALKNLPPKLNDIYQRTLERVTSNKGAPEKNKEYLLRALRWLTFSMVPLTLSQVEEAASDLIDEDGFYDEGSILDEGKILELGGCLLRVNRETKCLEFSHFTVKDFFLQLGNLSQCPPSLDFFKLNRVESHRWLAKFCLRYMMLRNFKDAYRFTTDNEFLDLYNYPLLGYVDYYWDEHARAALPYWDDDLQALVKDFLQVQNNYYFFRWRKCNSIPDIGDSRPGCWMSGFFGDDGTQLLFAAGSGLLGAVEELLGQQIDVNTLIPGCETPLTVALQRFYEPYDDYPAGELSKNQQRPLSQDYDKIISLLISSGADPNINGPGLDNIARFFRSPKYSPAVAELIFPKLRNPVSKIAISILCERLENKWITNADAIRLLELSAAEVWDKDGKFKICQALRRNGASELEVRHLVDIHQLDENDRSNAAEPFAMRRSHTFEEETAAQYLPNLLSAAKAGMSDTVNTIVSEYPWIASRRDSEGHNALDYACIWGHGAVVSRLLSCDQVSVDAQDAQGWSALHSACYYVQYDCCRRLLDAGADVNLQREDGQTPLMDLWETWYEVISSTTGGGDQRTFFRISDDLISSKSIDFSLKSQTNFTYLHFASRLPDSKYLQAILSQNPAINLEAQDDSGATALQLAAENEHNSSLVKLLLSHNANINTSNKYGITALIGACRFGTPDAVTLLAEAGADMFTRNTQGFLPQHFACLSPNPDTLMSLLKAAKVSGSQISCAELTGDGRTMLHLAVQNDIPKTGFKLVEQLLKEPGVDANIVDGYQRTAFALAAEILKGEPGPSDGQQNYHSVDSPCYQRLQTLKALLPRTTSPNRFDAFDETPLASTLQIACELCWKDCHFTLKTHPQIGLESDVTTHGGTPLLFLLNATTPNISRVKYLLSIGASPTAIAPDGLTTLHMALDLPYTGDLVRVLCAKGADVNAQCTKGKTPLMIAAEKGKLDVVQSLLIHGAGVTATDSNGESVIHYAIRGSGVGAAIVRMLISAGASTENCATDGPRKGYVPLLHAAYIGNLEVLDLLLDQESINVLAKLTSSEEGIWHIGVRSDSPLEVIRVLREKNIQAPINLRSVKKETPLHVALRLGCGQAIIEDLIAAGSDILAEDSFGVSCLQYAIEDRMTNIVSLMLKQLPPFDCTQGPKVKFSHRSSRHNAQIINLLLGRHENILNDDVLLFAELEGLTDETYILIASFIRQGKVYDGACFIGDAAGRAAFSKAAAHRNLQFCQFLEEWKPTEADDSVPSVPPQEQPPIPPIINRNPNYNPSSTRPDEALFHRLSERIWLNEFESVMPELLSDGNFEKMKNNPYQPLWTVGARTSSTILQIAINYKNPTAIKFLLLNGCLLRTLDLKGKDALFYILKNDDSATLTFVANLLENLESKKDHRINLRGSRSFPRYYDTSHLHYLARKGGWRCVRTLVEKASVFFNIPEDVKPFSIINLRDPFGNTSMRRAITNDNSKFVEEMLKLPQKPDVSAWGVDDSHALINLALEEGQPEIAKILKIHYPELRSDHCDRFRPELDLFSNATSTQHLQILLQTGANLNFWDPVQGHAIHYLLEQGHYEALDVVLNHMGSEWAIMMLTKRASALGQGLEIVGRRGLNYRFKVLQAYFGPLLPAIRVEYLKEGATAANNQFYLELAGEINWIVEQRMKMETWGPVIEAPGIHKLCSRAHAVIKFP